MGLLRALLLIAAIGLAYVKVFLTDGNTSLLWLTVGLLCCVLLNQALDDPGGRK